MAYYFLFTYLLKVEGTVAQNGICLGDISGDGHFELIVGNEAGELFIFKVLEHLLLR